MLLFCEVLPSPRSLGNGCGWSTRTAPSTMRLTYDACSPACRKMMRDSRRCRRLPHLEASDCFSRRTLSSLDGDAAVSCCTTVDVVGGQDIDLRWSKQILLTFPSHRWHHWHMQQKNAFAASATLFLLLLFFIVFVFYGAVRESGIMRVEKEHTSFYFLVVFLFI